MLLRRTVTRLTRFELRALFITAAPVQLSPLHQVDLAQAQPPEKGVPRLGAAQPPTIRCVRSTSLLTYVEPHSSVTRLLLSVDVLNEVPRSVNRLTRTSHVRTV